jgi:hypothetical protein
MKQNTRRLSTIMVLVALLASGPRVEASDESAVPAREARLSLDSTPIGSAVERLREAPLDESALVTDQTTPTAGTNAQTNKPKRDPFKLLLGVVSLVFVAGVLTLSVLARYMS